MRRLLLALLLLFLAVVLPACGSTTAAAVLTTVQQMLQGFQVYAQGVDEGTPATFQGELGFNATYLAVDAEVDAALRYYAPDAEGNPILVWERSIQRGSGQRAYKVVFVAAEGQDFIQIVRVSWAEARTQLVHLSEATDEPFAPEASPLVPVADPRP